MWSREIQLLYRLEEVGPSGVETDETVLRLAKEIREAVETQRAKDDEEKAAKKAKKAEAKASKAAAADEEEEE